MSDQNINTEKPEQTDAKKPDEKEIMIPKSRFDEVNQEKIELAKELKKRDETEKAETEKRLAEQNEYKQLADNRAKELADLQPKAARVDAYEKTLTEVLEAQIASLPEDKRSLVPDELTTQQKLSWLSKNAAILKAPAAFDIGAGHSGGGENKNIQLSQEEIETAKKFGVTPEEYAKNKK